KRIQHRGALGVSAPPPAPAVRPAHDPEGADWTAAEAAEHVRRATLQIPGWSTADDLTLVEGLRRGEKAAALADRLRVTREWLKGRWAELCPDPTLRNQELVHAALKAAVHGEVEA
ncbi:MAG: hypothetical protein H5U20_07650, partial [Rhodobacteraceae bacterium]|nr:hypothetical protein [Paracoccaceae bacterium]